MRKTLEDQWLAHLKLGIRMTASARTEPSKIWVKLTKNLPLQIRMATTRMMLQTPWINPTVGMKPEEVMESSQRRRSSTLSKRSLTRLVSSLTRKIQISTRRHARDFRTERALSEVVKRRSRRLRSWRSNWGNWPNKKRLSRAPMKNWKDRINTGKICSRISSSLRLSLEIQQGPISQTTLSRAQMILQPTFHMTVWISQEEMWWRDRKDLTVVIMMSWVWWRSRTLYQIDMPWITMPQACTEISASIRTPLSLVEISRICIVGCNL